MLSLFVAVILVSLLYFQMSPQLSSSTLTMPQDNLEMDEELKKLKQVKAREQTTTSRTKLPLRLNVFTRFPDRPQMVVVKRLPGDFPLPRVRQSFTKQFADEENEDAEEESVQGVPSFFALFRIPDQFYTFQEEASRSTFWKLASRPGRNRKLGSGVSDI